MSNLPIACTLTTPELQERRSKVLEKVRAATLEVNETKDGFVYRFPSDALLLADLFKLIQLEHECCPFLRFSLVVEAGNGPVCLELTGPPGTKELLTSIF